MKLNTITREQKTQKAPHRMLLMRGRSSLGAKQNASAAPAISIDEHKMSNVEIMQIMLGGSVDYTGQAHNDKK